VAKYLIENKADVNLTDNNNRTPLCIAVKLRNVEIVKLLLDNGADINMADENGDTPLFISVDSFDSDTLQVLIDNGADVNCVKTDGTSPIHRAASLGNLTAVKILSERCELNARTVKDDSPVLIAALNGHSEIVKYLVANKADVNVANKAGLTPLFHFVSCGDFPMVKYLVENGADVSAANFGPTTAAYAAAKTGSFPMVKYLLDQQPCQIERHRFMSSCSGRSLCSCQPVVRAWSEREQCDERGRHCFAPGGGAGIHTDCHDPGRKWRRIEFDQ
jgi:ankyrin repeat protein